MSRSRTSNAWLREHVTDPYVQRARAEGYRSRAAFKLLEIDAKDHLIRPDMLIIDLGAAPGGWSQVAARKFGAAAGAKSGRVIALDMLEFEPLPGVEFLQGDFREAPTLERLVNTLAGRPVDLVLSDMSPNISGIALSDEGRCTHLGELALEFCSEQLRPGGVVLLKVFQGRGFDAVRTAMRELFESVAVRKPRASRGRSNEVYLLGRGRKA
jgi:23S rRNA (uridine2552-2'-O)-methyltransferase